MKTSPSLDQDNAWKQVVGRDARATFLYAVTSTGIFCRPSCPSRRPARKNVLFFAGLQEAQAAGFRACKRCRPGEPSADSVLVGKLCAYIVDNLDERITLTDLAAIARLSPFTVQRIFMRVLGVSPSAYQRELRSRNFKSELSNKGASVTEAIYGCGYSSPSRVYEHAHERLGMSPAKYRSQGKGERIRFTVAACALGYLLVASTDKGLCAVTLGDDAAGLEVGLRTQFPTADLVADSSLDHVIRQVLNESGCDPLASELSLDLRATAFQLRVWQALRHIPRGQTRSYAEVAREIGQPTAVRAVARACSSNPVAVVIPCHRVVGSDGNLTGYRWGLERKRKLLEAERSGAVSKQP